MNYQLHYDMLIARAKTRLLTSYTENHHVVPRCLGGSNDKSNLVKLTPEEHYVAHQLLVKLNRGNPKISFAAIAMSSSTRYVNRTSNKIYGWLRKDYADVMSAKMKGNTYGKGKKLSDAHLNILRKPKSEDHKRKISDGNKGKTKDIPRGPQSEEHKRKKGESRAKAWALWRLKKAEGELSS